MVDCNKMSKIRAACHICWKDICVGDRAVKDRSGRIYCSDCAKRYDRIGDEILIEEQRISYVE
jgi:hypothetical protein